MNASVAVLVAGLILTVTRQDGGTFVLVNTDGVSGNHPRHYPIMLIPRTNVASHSAGSLYPVPGIATHFYWPLTGCTLKWVALDPPKLQPTIPAWEDVDQSNESNLVRLPRLQGQLGSNGTIDSGAWATPGSTGKATAVVEFTNGSLSVGRVVRESNKEATAFRFYDSAGGHPTQNPPRALAQDLLYTGEFNEITFEGDKCQEKRIQLSGSIPTTDPILLLNIPDDPTVFSDSSHFQAFYDLIKNHSTNRFFPHRLHTVAAASSTRRKAQALDAASASAATSKARVGPKGQCAKGISSTCIDTLLSILVSPTDPFCPGSQWP